MITIQNTLKKQKREEKTYLSVKLHRQINEYEERKTYITIYNELFTKEILFESYSLNAQAFDLNHKSSSGE